MASKNLKTLADTLADLRQKDFRTFCVQLRKRSNDPILQNPADRDPDPMEITDLLVSTYTEVGALPVAEEILRQIGCHDAADRLDVGADGGRQSFTPDPSDKMVFVDKYKFRLIQRVRNVEPILDELLSKGIIQQESHDEIISLLTSEKMMTELFDCLEAVGVEGKVILYNIIEEREPYVIEQIDEILVGQWNTTAVLPMPFWEESVMPVQIRRRSAKLFAPKRTMLTGCQISPEDDWIKLEPEVNCVDAEVAPTYSLQSEAGNFECGVSGLRWVCKEKVSFKYHFGSWGEHMERLETMQYIPGGPLQDIRVIAGKLDEVYLPHWICTDGNPTVWGRFAVLHIDNCGDVVEQVSEVTPSHVKLSEPIFSPRGVLMKAGFPVKINCKVLIYKTNKAFLTLHVYLIPRDPALQETIKNKEFSSGYKMIQKPYPEKSLKMRDCFILTADKGNAEIYPKQLKLVYEGSDPNFFEVFIQNPDNDFQLTLRHESGPVWTSVIRKDDYQNTGDVQVKYDVELASVRSKLVLRVSRELINQLLDNLLEDLVLNDGEKDSILRENNTNADRARCLIDMVKKKGCEASRILFTHLQSIDPTLSAELRLPSGLPVQPGKVCLCRAGPR